LPNMEFVESTVFSKTYRKYLTEDEYLRLQETLVAEPELGDVMPGTGGFRKLRWSDPRRGKGRRGGLRIIYYYFTSDGQIWFMTMFDKGEMSDLSPSERKLLREAVAQEIHARRKKSGRLAREK
jgi:hypothetical protein